MNVKVFDQYRTLPNPHGWESRKEHKFPLQSIPKVTSLQVSSGHDPKLDYFSPSIAELYCKHMTPKDKEAKLVRYHGGRISQLSHGNL